MKTSKFIITLAAITLCLSVNMFAQGKDDKDKLEAMPATATLAESQDWLLKNIKKNFGYTSIDDTVKISDLKIENCTVSFRQMQNYTDQKSALGDRPALGNTGATAAKEIRYSVLEDITFNLKDIDAAQIGLGALPKPKQMQGISLQTIGKKDLITYNRTGSQVQYNASGKRSLVLLPVKEKAGESIAKGFMQVIRQCQAAK
jgi:hypothetical protein